MKVDYLHKRDSEKEEDILDIGIIRSIPTKGEGKNLALCLDFINEITLIFIRRSRVDVSWMEKLFDTLKESGFAMYGIEEIRFDCWDEIEIEENKDQVKIIDEGKGKIYHTKPEEGARFTSDGSSLISTDSYISDIDS